MQRIPLAEASAGQRVARAVATPTGTVLVQAGEVLTAETLAGLRRKGVDSVIVEGDEPGQLRPLEERLADLEARFAGHEGNPLMMELKSVIAEQMAQGALRADG